MKLMKNCWGKILICLVVITFWTAIAEAAIPTVEITPSRFELLVAPRGQNVQSMKISNLSKDPISFTATTRDWDLSADGRVLLQDPGTVAQSASSWIRFNPKEFTIQGGQTQFIRFSISVPPNAQPGEYRTSLVLETKEKYEMQEGFFFKPTFAILVYISVPDVKRLGEMNEIKVTVDDKGAYSLEGQIRSLGNAHLRITGEYFLYNSDGKEIKNEQAGKKVILPGRSDTFKIDLGKDLAPGTYKLKLIWYYLPAFYMEGKLDEYPKDQQGLQKEFAFTI